MQMQLRSSKTTEPGIRFTKAHRDKDSGMFKDHMATKPLKMKLPHPKI